jgi:hypothetical protein
MMLDGAVTPEPPGLGQTPFQQQLSTFIPTLLSPIRDNRMSKHRMNAAVARIDNQQGYSKKLSGYF